MKLARPPTILFAVVLVSCVENTGVIPITGRVPSDPSPMEEPQEAPDEMAPAGDYSQPGPWWASTVKMAFTGRGGNELITHIWYPTTDEGRARSSTVGLLRRIQERRFPSGSRIARSHDQS